MTPEEREEAERKFYAGNRYYLRQAKPIPTDRKWIDWGVCSRNHRDEDGRMTYIREFWFSLRLPWKRMLYDIDSDNEVRCFPDLVVRFIPRIVISDAVHS